MFETAFRRNRTTFIAAGVTALVLGGGAYAAIPAADGTITACMNPDGTNIRLLDTATTTTCPTGQEKVTWNQKGEGFTPRGTYDMAKDKAGEYKKGDVLTISTGCPQYDLRSLTTGAYVKTSNAPWPNDYPPCFYREPEGWQVLTTNAARGPTGPMGSRGPAGPSYVYWAKFDENGTFISSNHPTSYAWGSQHGQVLLSFANVNVKKCAITVTAVDPEAYMTGLSANYSVYYDTYMYARAYRGTTAAKAAMDVVWNCRYDAVTG